MTAVDFTKFPYAGVEDPHASTLTDGITWDPALSGFALVMIKVTDADSFTVAARTFAAALRSDAARSGLIDITAYRFVRPDELGGAVPFDRAIVDDALRNAEKFHAEEPDKYPTIEPALKMTRENDVADWVLFVEFETPDRAKTAASEWHEGGSSFAALTRSVDSHTVCTFRNLKRYSTVSRDPNVIQFFNLFPGPGDSDDLWQGWQEALPWFFEAGEMRSSFPLVALDPDQPILVVNHAHFDSLKHFFLGVCYDPNYLETVTRAYSDRGFALPMPFFCKIVPV